MKDNATVAGVNGLGREAPPKLPTVPDAEAPQTREEFEKKITHGCARALALATEPKELTEAIKASSAWFQVLYPNNDPSKDYGKKLGGGDGA